jgi:homopolymeric O-antigen transport system permease protein
MSEDLKHFWNIVFYRAIAELKAENSRKLAGYVWWILEPLMSLAVYYCVFSFLKFREENFTAFLLIGIITWRWFNASVMRSANSLKTNRNLMLEINVSKTLFPLTVVSVAVVKFSLSLLLLLVLLVILGINITPFWFFLPLLLVLQLLIIVGCSFTVASITPFFPDFSFILDTLLTLMFFASGILYPLDKLPERVQQFLVLNPMAILIEQYRNILMYNRYPDISKLVIILIEGLIIFALGYFTLKKFNRTYPKII